MRSDLINRVGLGTVQFGLDYGINNETGKVSYSQVAEILELAIKSGIKVLDTASSYGESEKVLGRYFKNNGCSFKVVSKCKPVDEYAKDFVRSNLNESLKLLSCKEIYGYLIHRFDDYKKFPELLDDFLELRQKGLVKKIGFSIYLPEELELLLDNDVIFDLLQVPYSVFDRRFEPYFKRLKERSVEIHVRSLFLQGLAFMAEKNLPKKLIGAGRHLKALNQISLANGLSHSDICLNFALMDQYVDQIIIGVDSIEQLRNNLSALDEHCRMTFLLNELSKVRIEDEAILLPYQWN